MKNLKSQADISLDIAPVIEELLQRIGHEFRAVPRPSKITKTVARALDDDWHIKESRRLRLYASDPETHWNQLTDSDIEYYADIFAFLDGEGYLFYLPAYMSQILQRYPFGGRNYIDFTIYACTHSCDSFCLFSREQMRCVIDFLTFCAFNDHFCDAGQAVKAVELLETCLNAPNS